MVQVGDLAPLVGLSRNALYECIHRGELGVVRVGRRIIIPRHCVERWLLLGGAGPEPRP